MAKGINIGIASDTRDFKRGVDSGVIDPLDGVKDVLEDVVKAGDHAGRDLNQTFLEQQQTTKDLRKDYQKLNQEISEGSRTSSRSVSDNTRRGAHEASEGISEIGESSRSNAIEVAASFDGSAQSISDGFQGLAAEVFAGFGPAGVAAGVAAAAGIGLISTAIQGGQEDTDAFKQDVSDLASDLIETGSRGSASIDKIVSSLQDLATGQDSAGNTLGSLRKIAKDTGISFDDLAQAYAGNSHGLSSLLTQQKRHLDSLREQQAQNNRTGSTYARAATDLDKQVIAQEKLVSTLDQTQKKQKAAAKEQKDYVDSGAEALDLASQATQSYASSVQGAYEQAGASISDFVKDGKFNLDDYQKKTEENAQAIVDYQANIATATADLAKGGHDKAIQYLEQLGPDAAPLIAAFIKAPEAQKASLEATWDTLGGAASTSFGSSLQKNLDSRPATQTVKLVPDDSAIINLLAFKKRNPDSIPVPLIPTGSLGSGVKRNP